MTGLNNVIQYWCYGTLTFFRKGTSSEIEMLYPTRQTKVPKSKYASSAFLNIHQMHNILNSHIRHLENDLDMLSYERQREERIKENRRMLDMIFSGKLSQIFCFKLLT